MLQVSRQGDRALATWLQKLQPYMVEWATATAIENLWLDNEPFVRADFDQYLQTYRQSTRIRLLPTLQPDQMQPASVIDMYPLHGIGGAAVLCGTY